MTRLAASLHFVNIFAAALVAGGQFVVLTVIMPVKRAVSARLSVQIHTAMLGHQIDRSMKPLGLVAGLSALALLAMVSEHQPANIVLLVVGILGLIGVVITSRYFNVRTNREMATWSLDAIPEDYDRTRARWDRVHTIRTTAGLIALASFVASGLVH